MGLLDELDEVEGYESPFADTGYDESREPEGLLGHTFDILSRPNYASAKFFDTLAEDGLGAVGDALINGAAEFVAPKQRLSFNDLIKKYQPDFAKEHPYATIGLGFIGDVALDPTTYLSFGTSSAIRVGGKALSKKGVKVLGETIAGLGDAVPKVDDAIESAFAHIANNRQSIDEIEKVAGQIVSNATEPARARTIIDSLGAERNNLSTEQFDGMFNELKGLVPESQFAGVNQTRQTADKMILDMIAAGRTDLVDKGGMKFAGKTLISGDAFSKISQITGLSRATKAIRDTKLFETFAKGFDRNWNLPEEFIDQRKLLEAELDNSAENAFKLVGDHANKLDTKQREKMAKMLYEIDDATRVAETSAGRQLMEPEAQDIAQRFVRGANLNETELAYYSRHRQVLDDILKAEQKAGILKEGITNYSNRVYQAVEDGQGFIFYRKAKTGKVPSFLGSSEARVFDSIEAAKAAGFVPEMDAAVLLALRAQSSTKAIAKKNFNTWVDAAYGDLKKAASNPYNHNAVKQLKQWNRIAEDIQFIGQSNFPSGLGSAQLEFGKMYDSLLNKFKALATTAKPAFGPKQFVANSLQAIMEQGAKAFKIFDPRAMTDAATLLMYDKGVVRAGTPTAEKILNGVLSNPLGEKRTMKEVLEGAKKYGVLADANLSGEALKHKVQDLLSQDAFIHKTFGDKNAGLGKAIVGSVKYWNIPGSVENLFRLSMYMNGLRIGHTEKMAAALAEKTFFNYRHGLSQFERQWLRRIVPFYSFQRFAVPFTARLIGQHPGRAANLGDAARGLFDGWNKFESGDALNEDERRVVPGYLLEQPHVLAKFNDRMQAVFRTFNNFSPLEMLGMVETTDKGDIDYNRTMLKSVLAQISPMLKLPFEVLTKKNFFTDQSLDKAKNPKAGKIGKLDPELFLGSAAGFIQGAQGGTRDQAIQFLKQTLSWEQDPKTGNVYINPYIAHTVTSTVPIMSQIIRMSNPDRTPHEKVLDLLAGIGTQKVNLKQSYKIQRFQEKKEVQELQSRIRLALIHGQKTEAEKARDELQELLKSIAEERSQISYGNIRGGM